DGRPSNGPIQPTSYAYYKSIAPIKRDLAKARAKLAEGGQSGGFTFTMTTNNLPINIQEAEVIQAQVREASITMKIKLVDAATLLSDGNSRNFDMISYQWSGRPDPDGNTYQFFRTTPGTSLNCSGISALLHLTPGEPIDAMMAESVDAEAKASLRKELGLDRPIHEQYAAWMRRLLRGDLGRSIRNGEPVIENVSRRIRPSLELALL